MIRPIILLMEILLVRPKDSMKGVETYFFIERKYLFLPKSEVFFLKKSDVFPTEA